jgi:hypothetical protein
MKVFMPHEPRQSRRNRQNADTKGPATQPTTEPSTDEQAPTLVPSRMAEVLQDGPYKDQALVPVSPWIDNKPPAKPSLQLKRDGSTVTARFHPKWRLFGGERPWQWAVYVRRGDTWDFHVYPGDKRGIVLTSDPGAPGDITAVAVAQVDRCGNESKRNVQEVK